MRTLRIQVSKEIMQVTERKRKVLEIEIKVPEEIRQVQEVKVLVDMVWIFVMKSRYT